METPNAILAYIDAANSKNATAFVNVFTNDATYHDEGKTYVGHTEIARWKQAFDQALTVDNELVKVTLLPNNVFEVKVKVTGNFPGSPQTFTQHIELANGKIKSLKVL